MKEKFQFQLRDIVPIIRRYMRHFLILAAVSFALVLIFQIVTKDRLTVAAVVSFSFDGIELGRDPAGNRFNEREMKCEEVIRRAAEAMEMELTTEDFDIIQSAIEIRGYVEDDAFESVIEHLTIFEDNQVGNAEGIQETAYFPSKYSVVFHYRMAHLSQNKGAAFLQELLSAYEGYFYERYGYNHSLEESVSALDFNEYDYIDAVEILDARLYSLRAYLSVLAEKDNTRFVSSRTGFAFSDLVDAVDAIRNEDINLLFSRVLTNNITKDLSSLIDYYLYRIDEAEREVTELQTRIDTLATQIQEYEKTRTVLWGTAGSDSEEQQGMNYEFTQHSEMYDKLFNEKVECETSLSSTREQIALFQRRIERLQSGAAAGEDSIAISELLRVSEKVERLLVSTSETADEYFRTVQLKRAFQILQEPKLSSRGLLRDTVIACAIVYTLMLGLVALWIPAAVGVSRKMRAKESRQSENESSSVAIVNAENTAD